MFCLWVKSRKWLNHRAVPSHCFSRLNIPTSRLHNQQCATTFEHDDDDDEDDDDDDEDEDSLIRA